MSEIKNTEKVSVTDKPSEFNNKSVETKKVNEKLDARSEEFVQNNEKKGFKHGVSGDGSKKGVTPERQLGNKEQDLKRESGKQLGTKRDTDKLVMKVTGFTEKGMKRTTPEWRQKHSPQLMREHHLVPQAMLKDQKFVQRLKQLGIENPKAFIDRKIAQIPNVKHVEIHQHQGWNKDFAKWFKEHPNFSHKDLEAGIKDQMKKYGVPKSSRSFTRAYRKN